MVNMLEGIYLGMLLLIFPQIVLANAIQYPFYVFLASCGFVSLFYKAVEDERNYDQNIWAR